MYVNCYHTLDSLANICREYHSRIERLEEEKYDLEYIVKGKDYQVHIDIHTKHKKKYFKKTFFSNIDKKLF